MVTYDTTGHAEFIELAKPFNPTIEGVLLIGRPVDEVTRDLRAKNIELSEYAPDVFTVVGWCVGLWAPWPELAVESVGIGPEVDGL